MKNYIIILLLVINYSCYSQGNLQFNRAIAFSNNGTVSSGTVSTFETITIPPGKVWKIESVALAGTDSSNTIFQFTAGSGSTTKWLYARFNDIIAYSGDNLGNQNNLLPIWLNSGTYLFKISSAYSNSSGGVLASYSAIEFNIIP